MSNRFPVNILLLNFVILHQRRDLITLIDETFEDIKFAESRTSDVTRVNSLHVFRSKFLIRGVFQTGYNFLTLKNTVLLQFERRNRKAVLLSV